MVLRRVPIEMHSYNKRIYPTHHILIVHFQHALRFNKFDEMVVIVGRQFTLSLLLRVQIRANNRRVRKNVTCATTQRDGMVVTPFAARLDTFELDFRGQFKIGIGIVSSGGEASVCTP